MRLEANPESTAPAFHANIRIGQKGIPGTNALAYLLIPAVKKIESLDMRHANTN